MNINPFDERILADMHRIQEQLRGIGIEESPDPTAEDITFLTMKHQTRILSRIPSASF